MTNGKSESDGSYTAVSFGSKEGLKAMDPALITKYQKNPAKESQKNVGTISK